MVDREFDNLGWIELDYQMHFEAFKKFVDQDVQVDDPRDTDTVANLLSHHPPHQEHGSETSIFLVILSGVHRVEWMNGRSF